MQGCRLSSEYGTTVFDARGFQRIVRRLFYLIFSSAIHYAVGHQVVAKALDAACMSRETILRDWQSALVTSRVGVATAKRKK